jgi:rubredoxin
MTKQFRCPVCGYVHSGDTAPDFCPVCKAPGDSFVEITQDAKHYALTPRCSKACA